MMTNDGNAILREVRTRAAAAAQNGRHLFSLRYAAQIQVQHPAAKSMIEISRTQDEEVGDGTTSVIILGKYQCMPGSCCLTVLVAGEMLSVAEPFLEQQVHPTVIINAFRQALEDMTNYAKEKLRCVCVRTAYPSHFLVCSNSVKVDVTNHDELMKIVKSAIGTKFIRKWFGSVYTIPLLCNPFQLRSDMACRMAIVAVQTVTEEEKSGKKVIDIKRYARVEKVCLSVL